jgi:hypothetical protein
MERRGFRSGIAIGAAIGALLAAVSFCYLLAFEPGGFKVGANASIGMLMIGVILGALFGWVFSSPRPTAEAVIGVPQRGSIRIVMWLTTAMALLFALGAGREGELVEALGWLGLAGAWTLQASGAAERARILLYLSGGVLLLGLLSLGSAFILGEL